MDNNTQTLLSEIKLELGYTTNKLDNNITSYINAGKKDLVMAGIVEEKVVESDALIYCALKSFVLSMMDTYEHKELSANAYALQKDQLRHYISYTTQGE